MAPPLDIPAVILRQERIILKYLGYRDLKRQYNWTEQDLRVGMLDTLANDLIAQLVFLHTLPVVGDDAWWDSHFPTNKEEEIKKKYRMLFLKRTRWWQYVVFWSKLEANLRLLSRYVINEDLSRENYYQVYKEILEKLNLGDMKEFFEYWSKVRNLIHNDFHFRPKNNLKKELNYRGNQIKFIPDELFNEFSISDTMDIYEDTYDVVVKIITSAEILNYEFIWDKWV